MADGTTKELQHHWWSAIAAGQRGAVVGSVERLKKCYVYGSVNIDPEEYAKLRSSYTGCVYPYWDYEKVIKFDDMRRDGWNRESAERKRTEYQKRRANHLVSTVKEKHAEITKIRKDWRFDQELMFAALHLMVEGGIACGSRELLRAVELLRTRSLSEFQREVGEWSRNTFGPSNIPAKIAHMEREVAELRASPTDSAEMADVLILLAGIADEAGVDLLAAGEEKMRINRARTWSAPDAQGVCSHVEAAGKEGA